MRIERARKSEGGVDWEEKRGGKRIVVIEEGFALN